MAWQEQVGKIYDELVENNVNWSACANPRGNAEKGMREKMSVKVFRREIPADWLNKHVIYREKVTCSGGSRRTAGSFACLCRSGSDGFGPF
ncbi:MAG: hypothetical protein ACLSG9_10165 [Eubacterium sp.]